MSRNTAVGLLPNGLTLGFGYHSLNRLTSVQQTVGTTPVASYTYTLGPDGNRTKVTEADGTAVAWTYDAAYRLTGETVTNPAGVTTASPSATPTTRRATAPA